MVEKRTIISYNLLQLMILPKQTKYRRKQNGGSYLNTKEIALGELETKGLTNKNIKF